MEPTNFSWFIDGKIAALGFPSSHADVEFLCKIGVKQLISLTETPPCLYGMKLTQVHIPIDDMTAPSIQQVNEFLRVVELAHLKGEVKEQLERFRRVPGKKQTYDTVTVVRCSDRWATRTPGSCSAL